MEEHSIQGSESILGNKLKEKAYTKSRPNSHSTVPKSLIIFPKVVNALLCISPVIGICPSNKYVAASEVLSGRC
jgi:hypothetical protein